MSFMKKTSDKDFLDGYDKIWQKGPEVKHKYSKFDWDNTS